jgi:hypothetical protein
MIRRIEKLFTIVLMAMFVVSCSTTKLSKKSDSIEGLSESEYWESILSNQTEMVYEALTAKMTLELDAAGKKTKVNGTMRIKKGEVIQLSIAPLLGIEVARAEIYPDGILVIDRMGKRFVRVSFEQLQELTNAQLDFYTLQALFLNEIFLPGKKELTSRDFKAFEMEQVGREVRLDVRKTKGFAYSFLTEVPDALLKESSVGVKGMSYGLIWKYDNFRPFGQKPFPNFMKLSLQGAKKPMNASFSLSRLSTNSNWETRTKVSDRYEQVKLEDLIKQLLKK